MTAYQLEILLHYVHASVDHPDWTIQAKGALTAFDVLVEAILIEKVLDAKPIGEKLWQLTERGHALAEGLQHVPLPVQRWVVP